jgi:hypothetical protein
LLATYLGPVVIKYEGSDGPAEFVEVVALALEVFELVPKLTLGGGSLRRLALSLGDGDGGGDDKEERLPFVLLFIVKRLALPLDDGVEELMSGGGGREVCPDALVGKEEALSETVAEEIGPVS